MLASEEIDRLVVLARGLQHAATVARHRGLVVLAGDRSWCRAAAAAMLHACRFDAPRWLGEPCTAWPSVTPLERALQLLGEENSALVFDAHAGFDADAFGAAAGTVQAGGLLLLLTPPLDNWYRFTDPQHARLAVYPWRAADVSGRYLLRLARIVRESAEAYLIEEGNAFPALPEAPASAAAIPTDGVYASEEQREAVEALLHVATGHPHRPLVLLSDRGRGKSSALGIAAARLLLQGACRIVVTAPRPAAVTQLFVQAAKCLGLATDGRGPLSLRGGGELRFEPPDRMARQPLPCDLLLVDEAAALPASLLERMLRHHTRIAFATTVHGYEGTGRGFELRFRRVLDVVTPGWRRLLLRQPVRWAEADPLERFVFHALMLDAEPVAVEGLAGFALEECRVERLDRDRLAEEETTLSQLFGLLVLAHYRTSPNDLRQLLDGPNISLRLLRWRERVVGCLLSASEGGFDEALAQAIYRGERRPRGHLLPQSLAVHAGFYEAPMLTAERVIRIAVHPALRGRGVGRRLIEGLQWDAKTDGVDFVGAAFGGEAGLIAFWQKLGWYPVRVGLSKESSGGSHPLLVMHPLSAAGNALFEEAQGRFRFALPLLLADPLSQMEPELVAALEAALGAGPLATILTPRDWADLESFAHAGRDYGHCLPAVWKLVQRALGDGSLARLGERERAILTARVLQRHDVGAVAARFGLSGRREVQQALREAIGALLVEYRDSY